MKKITIFALVAAVALVAAALVGVGLAQLTTPNPTAVPQTPAPWCINGNPDVAAGYCAGPQAQGAYGYGAQGCQGYGAQGAGQNWFGGMMGGRGMMGRSW
ncbi:MAG TPA: hypothetical protein VLL96_02395 [Candidatus Deferrimicrobiaceae bacterium]|nr:hypothetical protein [Candidatus Deferrimicrobiaceae bacterium]